MTASQTIHLIEQFSAQAPFAIWITDSRGVAIFANQRLHDLFGIQDKPSSAIGSNIFDDAAIEALALGELRDRFRKGAMIDETIDIPETTHIDSGILTNRKGHMVIRVIGYPLMSSTLKIEHYVVLITDMSAATARHHKRRTQIKDIEVYNVSRKTRQARHAQLKAEVQALEDELRALGETP